MLYFRFIPFDTYISFHKNVLSLPCLVLSFRIQHENPNDLFLQKYFHRTHRRWGLVQVITNVPHGVGVVYQPEGLVHIPTGVLR